MSGLCGWMTSSGDGADGAESVLAAMGAGQPAFSGPLVEQQALPVAALRVQGPPPTTHFGCREAIVAAIDGAPRWQHERLRETARERGDAVALIEAYRRYGRELVQYIHGPWTLAVIDTHKRCALLAVDRLGIRPAAFAVGGGAFVFGSTADSIVAHPAIDPVIDPQAIFNLLYFTRIPAPGTIYRDVRKLVPAHCAWLEQGRVSVERYWTPAYEDRSRASFGELKEELHGILPRAHRRATDGWERARTGTYLSGGVDSSAVTGFLGDVSGSKVDAFGIGFDAEEYNEMAYARITARHFGAELHEYYVTPTDVADALPAIAGAYDEPFGNSSAIAAYFCARHARDNGMERLLAGDGGDEIFAGNSRYVTQQMFELYGLLPASLRVRLIEPLVGTFPRKGLFRKAQGYIRHANIALPERMESFNIYRDVAAATIFPEGLTAAVDPGEPLRGLEAHYADCPSASTLNRMLFLDMRTTLGDDDLRKVARTAELAGISVGFPLLDEDLVEFSCRVPPGLKIRRGRLRWFFKQALKGYLAEQTLSKSKHGFGLPFGVWLKTDPGLRAMVAELLGGLAGRGLLRTDFIAGARERFESGHAAYHGEVIWVLIVLELWLRSRPDVRIGP